MTSWHGLRYTVPAAWAELATAAVWELEPGGVEERDAGDEVELTLFRDRPWRAEEERHLLSALPPEAGSARLERFTLPDSDWLALWKRDWKPTLLGERVVVVPAWWEGELPSGRKVVRIDPGRAFGTGTHATTALAWELLEEAVLEAPPRRLLDVGTGSGLLALAALRLFPGALAVGTEADPQAVTSLRANLPPARASRFVPVTAEGLPFAPGSFDLAVANLTQAEQEAVDPELARVLQRGGRLILSGLLEGQDRVVGLWKARGAMVAPARSRDGWCAYRLKLPG